jgi:hypothetical protein
MMGLSGPQIDRMTVAQMVAAFEGFKQLHGAKPAGDVGRDEFMRVLAEETAAGRVLQ